MVKPSLNIDYLKYKYDLTTCNHCWTIDTIIKYYKNTDGTTNFIPDDSMIRTDQHYRCIICGEVQVKQQIEDEIIGITSFPEDTELHLIDQHYNMR